MCTILNEKVWIKRLINLLIKAEPPGVKTPKCVYRFWGALKKVTFCGSAGSSAKSDE